MHYRIELVLFWMIKLASKYFLFHKTYHRHLEAIGFNYSMKPFPYSISHTIFIYFCLHSLAIDIFDNIKRICHVIFVKCLPMGNIVGLYNFN